MVMRFEPVLWHAMQAITDLWHLAEPAPLIRQADAHIYYGLPWPHHVRSSWRARLLLLDKMSDQQIGQMYELMQSIQQRGRDSVDEETVDELYDPKNK